VPLAKVAIRMETAAVAAAVIMGEALLLMTTEEEEGLLSLEVFLEEAPLQATLQCRIQTEET
jgi:hypothetical protein